MSKELLLPARIRTVFGKKTHKLRRDGLLPAVLYGGRAKNATAISVSYAEFQKVFTKAGESTIISLELEQGGKKQVLIHDFSRDPLSDAFLHVDFYEIRMDEKLKTKIPLAFVGESFAVKSEGAILIRALQEVEIECLPQDLPHELAVDISRLKKVNDTVRIRDIAVPEGVRIHADPDDVIALAKPPRTEEELKGLEEAPVAAAVETVKVEGEEKKKERDAAKAEAETQTETKTKESKKESKKEEA